MNEALVGNPDRNPAGRWEDIKGTVIFLASAASDFVHGVMGVGWDAN